MVQVGAPVPAPRESTVPAQSLLEDTSSEPTTRRHSWWAHWTWRRRVGEGETGEPGVCVDCLPLDATWITASGLLYTTGSGAQLGTQDCSCPGSCREFMPVPTSSHLPLTGHCSWGRRIYPRHGAHRRVLALTLGRDCKRDGHRDDHGDGAGETD